MAYTAIAIAMTKQVCLPPVEEPTKAAAIEMHVAYHIFGMWCGIFGATPHMPQPHKRIHTTEGLLSQSGLLGTSKPNQPDQLCVKSTQANPSYNRTLPLCAMQLYYSVTYVDCSPRLAGQKQSVCCDPGFIASNEKSHLLMYQDHFNA